MTEKDSNRYYPVNGPFYLSSKEVLDYSIQLHDSVRGKVVDLLFDDEEWTLRYLKVQIEKEAQPFYLIPASKFKSTDWGRKNVIVDLSEDQLLNCPKPTEHLPVSREFEKKLNAYFETEDYWARSYYPPVGVPAVTHNHIRPKQAVRMFTRMVKEADIDTNLRSYKEVVGYAIQAKGERTGTLVDLLVTIPKMNVVALVTDLHKWLPWSKKVVLAARWADQINFIERSIDMDLSPKEIRNAFDYDPKEPVNDVLVRRQMDVTGRPVLN